MTDIVIPLIISVALGKTINIKDYQSYVKDYQHYHVLDSIFSKDVLIGETKVSDFHSRYYVYNNDKIPYSMFSLPIDLKLQNEYSPNFKKLFDEPFDKIVSHFYRANIVILSEYTKIIQSIDEYAEPIPDLTEHEQIKGHTHYFAKLHYGGRCISNIQIRSNVSGDLNILRRILRDVMGESGKMDEEAIDLWRTAYKAIKRSNDVRGEIEVSNRVSCSNAEIPTYSDTETLLEHLAEFPKYVKIHDLHGPLHQNPIFVTLKPLEEFDPLFKSFEKNEKSECYLRKLDRIFEDLHYADLEYYLVRRMPKEYNKEIEEFVDKIGDLKFEIEPLTRLSMYEEVNVTKYDHIFDTYYNGLNKSTENYFTFYRRLAEELVLICSDNFYKPVGGSLFVEDNEVVKTRSFCIAECQNQCLSHDKCRAVGYSERKNMCLIYYRSTYSAKILFPENNLDDMKIYDRICGI